MKHTRANCIVNTRDDERWSKDLVVVKDVLEADVYKLGRLASFIKPKTIVDIGGHIGSFSLKAKSVWPHANIFAFEPNVKNADLYRQNVQDNNLTNVKVYTEAVCYEKDKTVLTDDMRATGGGFMCAPEYIEQLQSYFVSRIDVKLVTFEELLARDNIQQVDLLKIDCEGSEREMIRQMSQEAADKVGLIVGEYHIEGGYPKFAELFYSKFRHLKLVRTNPNHQGNIGEFLAVPERLLSFF